MVHEKKFYITTPIYYVTAKPHLGSLYSTLIADVLARWHTVMGERVFFLTGTDEHGQKIAQAAHTAQMEPKAFVDSFIPAYKDAWKLYDINYSKFIRTTDAQHVSAVQRWLQQLIDAGDIYKATYTGWYCTSCETFVTEKDYDSSNSSPAPCPSCNRPTTYLSEETYFFRLSSYQEKLLAFYKSNPHFIQPKERFAEVINFVEAGLKDLSISRTTVSWGIPFPGDNKHIAYVWADALTNYITGVGFNTPGQEKEFNYWWPADVQVLGKDIVRFHAIFWPAFLMASNLALPKQLLVHGWITMGDQKMSKSLGNAVDPIELAHTYGVDQIRYYLMRQMAITHDSAFNIADIEQRIGSELANDLGNLLNRVTLLAHKYDAATLTAPAQWPAHAHALEVAAQEMIKETSAFMQEDLIHMALGRIWKYINQLNAYLHEQQPWKQVKNDSELFKTTLCAVVHGLQTVGVLLWPTMPSKMNVLLQSIGYDVLVPEIISAHAWNKQFTLTAIPPLFERPVQKNNDLESSKNGTLPTTQAKAPTVEQPTSPTISIDDFIKIELRIGTIEQAEFVEKSDKLLKLQVDFGSCGKRQIFSGIRKHYAPDELIGKQGTFVFNLSPRKMMGSESHGMMIFAEDASGKLQIVAPVAPVPNGVQLK